MTANVRKVPAPAVVLVTGGGGVLGTELAIRLAQDPAIERVLAVDTTVPDRDRDRGLGRVEFVRADLRDPALVKLIAAAGVDTVVHAAVSQDSPRSEGASSMKERNVIGTMRLLAACQRAASIRRVVVKSSSAVYGSSARDPALFTEQMDARSVRSGYAKDSIEIEGYVRGFARRRPDVAVTTLRFANVMGPRARTFLTDYIAMPFVPTVLGYDARIQLLHTDDAVAVLELAANADASGLFNVGGDGVIMLSQALRRAGRIPVPVPAPWVGPAGRFFRGARLVDFSPEQVSFLNFGRAIDCTRLIEELGYRPRWTTMATFDDYAHARGLRPLPDRKWARVVQSGAVALAGRLR
ncbi:MAG: NAD-dependent epimerase/dehydratase family protein [Mycobacteriaceae bacterium]